MKLGAIAGALAGVLHVVGAFLYATFVFGGGLSGPMELLVIVAVTAINAATLAIVGAIAGAVIGACALPFKKDGDKHQH